MAGSPYTPTRILSHPKDDFVYYIFQPSATSRFDSELVILNATETLETASLPLVTLASALPFTSTRTQQAYTPAIGDNGIILAFAGDCRNTSQGSSLWKYETSNGTSNTDRTWTQLDLSTQDNNENSKLKGANYLASGIAFSSTANATSELYVFGGMCPNETDATPTDWTSHADYSNAMLACRPQMSTSQNLQYLIGVSSSRGPPIAEAGFTITALQPTLSQATSDVATQQQHQNYVLLGGHTPSAFINMSQVALFSLPEQSWSFLPVEQSTATPRTDLAARAVTTVDPRSGHTAVLTSNGKHVVVFGGWVGDVKTSAEPQLAILEIGKGYGGDADWQWSIPDPSGVGPSTDRGLYGHGAVMLPGNVMMITGGYSIVGSSSTKAKRADPTPNSNSYFFNATSSTWSSSYTRPIIAGGPPDKPSTNPDYISTSRKVGLGAGLTFGVVAVLIVVMVYFWYSRRLKRRRDAQEELRGLSVIAKRANSSVTGHGISAQEMTSNNTFPLVKESSGGGRSSRETEAERTGLLFEVPSPTRGLRRSLHSRGAYQPAPRYDDGRLARGSGNIHPIDERDEYDEDMAKRDLAAGKGTAQRKDGSILRSAPALDPFLDPDVSRTPSPQSPAHERELEVRNWVSDWAAADALMHHHAGRFSPDKTDRTSSTLSDQSMHSAVSAQSWQHSLGTMSRSMSQRSAALFSARPVDVNNPMQAMDIQRTQSLAQYARSHNRRSQSLTLFSNPRRPDALDTYTPATTSFTQLQREGEALLGGHPDQSATSPTRTQSRARNWMGSVRRVFTGAERSDSALPENGELSTSSSPTKYHHNDAGIPRRAASTGTMLWQKRQGAKDWDVEGAPSRRVEGSANGQGQEDEEWDVESAIERRVVQVMFTVPKEKLRVVNRGPDGDGISVVSREGSVKDTAAAREGKGKGKGKATEHDRHA